MGEQNKRMPYPSDLSDEEWRKVEPYIPKPIKTTETPRVRGYDAWKKVKGRKRHILVDTIALLLTVVVHT